MTGQTKRNKTSKEKPLDECLKKYKKVRRSFGEIAQEPKRVSNI